MSIQYRLCALAIMFLIAVTGCKVAEPKAPAAVAAPTGTSIWSATQQTAIAEGRFIPLSDSSVTYRQSTPVADGTWEHPFLDDQIVTVSDARWHILNVQKPPLLYDSFRTRVLKPQG